MKPLSTRVHGIMDYVVGVILILSPWLFGFNDIAAARWVPMTLGAAALFYTLITRFEMGVWGLISVKSHLWLDVISGIFLAASPWIFGFSHFVFLPHVIFGLAEIAVAFSTETEPGRSYVKTHNKTRTHHFHRHSHA